MAWYRTLDKDQAARGINTDHFQILLGASTVTHMAGHLFVLEYLAGILAVTRRTVRTVRD